MAIATPGTIKIAGGVLVGGLVTGMLLAMAIPTQMTRKAETWRQMIGLREIGASETTIPVYAPPQDLTPVSWQTAAEEYPPLPNGGTALDSVYPGSSLADLDASDPVAPAYESLPPELLRPSDASATNLAAIDDDAASSAQAASAAAEEVQVQVQANDSTGSAPTTAAPPTTAAAPTSTDAA